MQYWEDVTLGKTEESAERYTLTADAIKSFAHEWDPFPPHIDETAAATSAVGQLFAAGVHLLSITIRLSHTVPHEDTSAIAGRGWDSVRFHRPGLAGMVLRARVTHLERKPGSRPERGVLVSRFELVDQDGQVVASFLNNVVMLRRTPADA
ncbi:dehydratase [Pandoraea terrae]|uniref:Dehydratase n=1 Tax=Pandoraea terrae TaxID=1537710 RepID=A0A5E4YW62_9BURK|nr:MaoC/PaaZ C-terminal domain-containing protein [Pandoraea terrae]VVE52370.1 dehydratase [Pandoraea terrae]